MFFIKMGYQTTNTVENLLDGCITHNWLTIAIPLATDNANTDSRGKLGVTFLLEEVVIQEVIRVLVTFFES